MYVLDTDILSPVYSGHPRVTSRQTTVPAEEIAITIITWIETLQGRFDFLLKAADGAQLLRAQELLVRTRNELDRIDAVFPVTELAADEFDRLRGLKKLKKIGRPDLLIASIALAERATLVTRNERDFRQVPGLRIENWAD